MSHTISIMNDGPLRLESDAQVLHSDGRTIDIEPKTMLCRCGQSGNKPFCDGSHRKQGFSGEREISEETVQQYPGKSVSVQFNRSICSGAARCVNNLPSVFKSDNPDNWIFPNNDTAERVIAAVKACPSGALSCMSDTELSDNASARPAPRVEIVDDGPYVVQDVELVGAPPANGFNPRGYALCRCGQSKNKPYCDYSHAGEHLD